MWYGEFKQYLNSSWKYDSICEIIKTKYYVARNLFVRLLYTFSTFLRTPMPMENPTLD